MAAAAFGCADDFADDLADDLADGARGGEAAAFRAVPDRDVVLAVLLAADREPDGRDAAEREPAGRDVPPPAAARGRDEPAEEARWRLGALAAVEERAADIDFAAAVSALAAEVIAFVAVFMACIAVDMVFAEDVAFVAAVVILLAAEVTFAAAEDTVRAADVAVTELPPRAGWLDRDPLCDAGLAVVFAEVLDVARPALLPVVDPPDERDEVDARLAVVVRRAERAGLAGRRITGADTESPPV